MRRRIKQLLDAPTFFWCTEHFSQSWWYQTKFAVWIEITIFPIDFTPNEIPFGAKPIGKVKFREIWSRLTWFREIFYEYIFKKIIIEPSCFLRTRRFEITMNDVLNTKSFFCPTLGELVFRFLWNWKENWQYDHNPLNLKAISALFLLV